MSIFTVEVQYHTQATSVIAATSAIQINHPFLLCMNRTSEFGKALLRMYRPTTVLLMLPLIKITGSAMPNAILEISGPALRRAGELTELPTNR